MQIQLYRYRGERNRINKNNYMTNQWVCNGSLKENTSLLKPIIEIDKVTPPQDNEYNYMYIPAFNRYYFITDIVNSANSFWQIHAKVDVLNTWRVDIMNAKCIVDKTEGAAIANVYLNDGSYVMDARKYNQVMQFPYGLPEQGNNILICAGG